MARSWSEDAQSWYLRSHAHLKQGAFNRAEGAFAQVHEYADSDVSVKFYWLQARYLDRQGVLDDRSRQLAQEILAIDPNSLKYLKCSRLLRSVTVMQRRQLRC